MTTLTVADLVGWMDRFTDAVLAHETELTDLDSAIGDADHGANLARGMTAVRDALQATPPTTVADFGKTVGMKLVSTVGGASGPLLGTLFLRFGQSGGTAESLDETALAAALRAGVQGVAERGKAVAGDKTMLDAAFPALDAMDAAVAAGEDGRAAAAAAAAAGRAATIPLVARKGRASYLGERSAGHMDPGAASTTLLFEALAA